MTNGLIGRKLGMTRVFAEDGTATPVTVIEAGPCQVVQVKTGTVQLGFGAQKATAGQQGGTRAREGGGPRGRRPGSSGNSMWRVTPRRRRVRP